MAQKQTDRISLIGAIRSSSYSQYRAAATIYQSKIPDIKCHQCNASAFLARRVTTTRLKS